MNLTKYTLIVVVTLFFLEAMVFLLFTANGFVNILALLLVPFFVFVVKKINNFKPENLKTKFKK